MPPSGDAVEVQGNTIHAGSSAKDCLLKSRCQFCWLVLGVEVDAHHDFADDIDCQASCSLLNGKDFAQWRRSDRCGP